MISLIQGQTPRTSLLSRDEPGEENPAAPAAPVSDSVVGYFASILVHALLLLFLAVFVYSPARETELIEVLNAEMEPLPEAEAITPVEVSQENLMAAAKDSDSSQSRHDARSVANASALPMRAVFLSNRSVQPAAQPADGNGWGGDALAGLGEHVGVSQVAGSGSEEAGEGEVGFFGTKAKGKSFVFIVDCSGSMTTPIPNAQPRLQAPITRFLRARQELSLSLSQLSRDQTFYVIFYNHETFPMFFPQTAQAMVPANGDMLGLARGWITKVVPGGGTDPRDAFQLALALRPQVIFFLTDGAIPPATRMVAKENNKSRTRIHTIAFGIQQHQDILKNIAADNQGRFRFVP